MPVTPPSSGIYDSATSILNAAKARVGERMPSLIAFNGNLLDYTQANAQQMFNNAWRKFQACLINCGSKKFNEEIVIEGIPPTASYNPKDQSSISWFQCGDGVGFTPTPVLPSDLITPLSISERQNGSCAQFPYPDTPNMDFYVDGLPRVQKYCFNGCWEWRGEVIYYPGATQSVDFLIRYRKVVPDIVDVGSTRWFQQPVPLVWCQDAFSWWNVFEAATAEAAKPDAPAGAMALAQAAKAEAMEATDRYVNGDIMLDERTEARRVPYGSGSGQSGRGGLVK